MAIKNPREANGPNGYPTDNPAFRELADRVLEERAGDVKRVKVYREKMREDLRRKATK